MLSLAALSVLGLSSVAGAARANGDACGPTDPAPCYSEDCGCTYCYGPENTAINPAVRPRTCNGDMVIDIAGFYWNAHMDGMEYAVNNHITNPVNLVDPPLEADIQTLNNLINASYETPDFKWDFGFKAGIGYNSACDGWDLGILWTWYQGRGSSHVEAQADNNQTLLPLWSAYSPLEGSVLYATDIETNWKLKLNLIDLDLGREFWSSKYVALRPFVGLRIAYLKQSYDLEHKGGSFTANTQVTTTDRNVNNFVDLENDFHGVGIRAGLDSTWNLGCGWGIYGNMAASIVYGRFSVDHNEYNRQAASPHSKIKVMETDYSFRASRAMLDLGLGLQWSTLFCGCQYGLTAQLGWEHHLFFNQNQMWRVNRIGDTFDGAVAEGEPNNTGENVFEQRRGDLDTQGWTLRLTFEF